MQGVRPRPGSGPALGGRVSNIPTRSREVVHARDGNRCVRCGMMPRPRHWHHRRGRAVDDDHQHAPCNGVTLCRTCHEWVHQHPFLAKAKGWIVARHLTPCEEPVEIHGQMVLIAHDTAMQYVLNDKEEW